MKYIKLFEERTSSQDLERLRELAQLMQERYSLEEKGLIQAWGTLLYLAYHDLSTDGPLVPESVYLETLAEYAELDETDPEFEDMTDWFSDEPPTISGVPLWNKTRLAQSFRQIAQKSLTPYPVTVYRTSRGKHEGPNSYSLRSGEYVGDGRAERAYHLPAGVPIIWGHGIADQDEVIWSPSQLDLEKYRI